MCLLLVGFLRIGMMVRRIVAGWGCVQMLTVQLEAVEIPIAQHLYDQRLRVFLHGLGSGTQVGGVDTMLSSAPINFGSYLMFLAVDSCSRLQQSVGTHLYWAYLRRNARRILIAT